MSDRGLLTRFKPHHYPKPYRHYSRFNLEGVLSGTMRGTLSEIDIRSIFQLIALGQRTGELFIEAYPPVSPNAHLEAPTPVLPYPYGSHPFWFVFFVNGQMVYTADHTNGRLGRLKDYLRRYEVEPALKNLSLSEIATTNDPEYAYLWWLLAQKKLTPAQARKIIENMVQETLFDLLSLHNGAFVFETGLALAPQLITLPVAPLITKMMKQLQQWKAFYPHIQLPQQSLHISHPLALQNALPEKAYQSLAYWADGKTTLRQLSRYLNRDLLSLAKGIYPYVERGWIHLVNEDSTHRPEESPLPENEETSPPKIVCIDDDLTVGRKIKAILSEKGYQVTVMSDPLDALTQLFYLKPDLILCDIAMPKLDGYELCAMIRHSRAFRQTPLIMLTGRDAFMDRVRARVAGATDYLTKPFGEQELLLLLEQYQ